MPEEVKNETKKSGKLIGNMLRRVKMFLGDALLLASPLKEQKIAGSKEKFTELQAEINGMLKDGQGVDLAAKRKELAKLYKLALPEILSEQKSDLENKSLVIGQQLLELNKNNLPIDPKMQQEFDMIQSQVKKVKKELLNAKVRARFVRGVSQAETDKALEEVKPIFVADTGVQLEIPGVFEEAEAVKEVEAEKAVEAPSLEIEEVKQAEAVEKQTVRQKGTKVAKLPIELELGLANAKTDVRDGKTISVQVKEDPAVVAAREAKQQRVSENLANKEEINRVYREKIKTDKQNEEYNELYRNNPLYAEAHLAKQQRVAENLANKDAIKKNYLEKLEMNKLAEAKALEGDIHTKDQEEVRDDYGYNTQGKSKEEIIERQAAEIKFQANHIQAQEALINKQSELIETQKEMLKILSNAKNFTEVAQNEVELELPKTR